VARGAFAAAATAVGVMKAIRHATAAAAAAIKVVPIVVVVVVVAAAAPRAPLSNSSSPCAGRAAVGGQCTVILVAWSILSRRYAGAGPPAPRRSSRPIWERSWQAFLGRSSSSWCYGPWCERSSRLFFGLTRSIARRWPGNPVGKNRFRSSRWTSC
jgi:hypothetical protein